MRLARHLPSDRFSLARQERDVRQPFRGVGLNERLTAAVILQVGNMAGVGHVRASREAFCGDDGNRRHRLAVGRRCDGILGLEADDKRRQHHESADCHGNSSFHKSS